jgi:hopanoid biosynthesis associated protein HpnK
VRRLVINADDFGLTCGVNRAILEAQRNGVVTSATLMANGAAFDDAVRTAATTHLSIGCHVVLVDGSPLLPAGQLPSLIASDGHFPVNLTTIARKALTRKLNAAEIEAEATAQIRRLQSVGITVTHVDTHKHTHMFPAVLRPLLRAAQACGVRAIRNPFVPPGTLPAWTILRSTKLLRRSAGVVALRRFNPTFNRLVHEIGMSTPDGCFGVVVTGSLDQDFFRQIATAIPDGTWELVCHPGYADADLAQVHTRLRQSRETELALLTSPEARSVLEKCGVELISYRDLAPK